jgi:hypothetical protein
MLITVRVDGEDCGNWKVRAGSTSACGTWDSGRTLVASASRGGLTAAQACKFVREGRRVAATVRVNTTNLNNGALLKLLNQVDFGRPGTTKAEWTNGSLAILEDINSGKKYSQSGKTKNNLHFPGKLFSNNPFQKNMAHQNIRSTLINAGKVTFRDIAEPPLLENGFNKVF